MRVITFTAALIAVSASAWAQNKGMVTLSNGTVRTDRTNPLTFTNPLILSTMTNSNAMNAVLTPQGQISNSTGVPSGAAATNAQLLADGSGSSAWVANRYISAVKTNDTVRSNTATFAADPELVVAVAANTTYRLDGYIGVTATTNGGFKADLTFPVLNRTNGIPLGVFAVNTANLATMGVAAATNRSLIASTVAYTQSGMMFFAVFRTATNGNVTFRWAQNASNSDATTVHTGSSMTVTRLTD
jgi:hypothetical protein